ncbi:MAG TPA: hypothetical protein VHX38_02145 [Pseudonocardiaceae bacterium]|jgi:hypothetical protein|nr:hypothetical protein [Pseudonocardiaceae bacterium]
MVDAEIRLSSGQAGAQFRALSKKLRQTGQTDLRRNLVKAIREAGKPVVQATQDAVRTIPITSEGTGAFAGDFRVPTNSRGGGQKQRREHKASKARTENARQRALKRGGSLREAAARTVKLKVTTRGIQIISDSKAMPQKQQTLPKRLDSPKGWRHPVFGNREVWVTEKGKPWFGATIQKYAPDFRAAVVDAMELTRDAIEK